MHLYSYVDRTKFLANYVFLVTCMSFKFDFESLGIFLVFFSLFNKFGIDINFYWNLPSQKEDITIYLNGKFERYTPGESKCMQTMQKDNLFLHCWQVGRVYERKTTTTIINQIPFNNSGYMGSYLTTGL